MLHLLENRELFEATAGMTHVELIARRSALEDRVAEVTRRRLEIANRVQVGIVALGSVQAAELEELRAERHALDAELDDLMTGLTAIRRITSARRETASRGDW